MPRPRPPPTPTGSTDLKALESVKALQASEMESMFALPPPAIRSAETQSQIQSAKSSAPRENPPSSFTQSTPPVSPKDKPLSSSPRHKRTASGAVKSLPDPPPPNGAANSSYALPPPPSRARKIIQMKPKSTTTNNSSPDSDASYQPTASAVSASGTAPKSAAGGAAATNSKRKQPSATSAAGRKIARKTAHSIIERRRRSKMNEEFGVLKDMIPACEGVEMHKLAILQAGIEYVRYLEGCVSQLKAENDKKGKADDSRMQVDEPVEDEDFDDEDEEEDDMATEDLPEPAPPTKIRNNRHSVSASNEWTMRDSRKSSVASLSSSAYPSPHILSQTHGSMDEQQAGGGAGMRKRPILPAGMSSFSSNASPSLAAIATSATPTPTMLSPAFNSIHFSPDLSRTQTNNSSLGRSSGTIGSISSASGGSSTSAPSTSTSWTTVNPNSGSNPSPNMAPLPSPKAAIHLPLPPNASSALQLPPPYGVGVLKDRESNSKSPGSLSDASGTAEATASAALMMLTNEWRGGAGTVERDRGDSKDRGKGMSVRDLLSS